MAVIAKPQEEKGDPIIQEMMEAGLHFGHRTSKTHPKMKPFITGVRNTVHIIDGDELQLLSMSGSQQLTGISGSIADNGQNPDFIGVGAGVGVGNNNMNYNNNNPNGVGAIVPAGSQPVMNAANNSNLAVKPQGSTLSNSGTFGLEDDDGFAATKHC